VRCDEAVMLAVPKTGSQGMRIRLFKLRQLSPKYLLFPRPLARETLNQSAWVYAASPAVPVSGQMFIHYHTATFSSRKEFHYLSVIKVNEDVLPGETLQVMTDVEGVHLVSHSFPMLENGTFDLGITGVGALTDGALIRWSINGADDLTQHDARGFPHQGDAPVGSPAGREQASFMHRLNDLDDGIPGDTCIGGQLIEFQGFVPGVASQITHHLYGVNCIP